MSTAERNLLYLLEKPYESLERPRGNIRVGYDLTTATPLATTTRVGIGEAAPAGGVGTRVLIPERTDAAPDQLGSATSLPLGTAFSFFLRPHRKAARDLCDIFMRTRNAEDLMQLAARVHGQVNEGLFIYALSFTIIRKQELRSMRLPSLVEMFPNKFVPGEQMTQAQVQASRSSPDQTEPIIIEHGPEFANTNIRPEHRVSYWREDYGMNSHHWHWHLIFPIEMGVSRDRKGELFFYMHNQMMARYDMERLSVGLNRVTKLENWREPVAEGYFSKLTVNNSGRAWGTRQDNTTMKDFRRNDFGLEFIDVTDMELWRARLMNAIHQGFMVNREGNRVVLSDDPAGDTKRGVEILGDSFEADAELSVNYLFYGDLHNIGHVILGFAHDPDFAHKEEMSVIGDPATTMRDPAFYRWHKFIDDVFQEYKLTLTPYTFEDLCVENVVVERAGVVRENQADSLLTGWNVREFEASRGIDFNSQRPVMLRLTHLDHQPFEYHIQVNNKLGTQKQVTVRIFMAPRENERQQTMSYMDQRLLWAEMDKFTLQLKPGPNHIKRLSKNSSITNPNEFTFRDLEKDRPAEPGTAENVDFDFCGCGWPQHLLLPRGKPEGMTYQLFIMISDFEKDKVVQPNTRRKCTNGVSFCGILDAKYPDARPMGFPFDRRPPPRLLNRDVTTAADLARLENCFIHDITITFTNQQLQK